MKRISTLYIFFSLAFVIASIASPSYVFGSEAITTSSSLPDEVTFADQNINQDAESSSVSSSTISSSPEIIDDSTTATSSFISDEEEITTTTTTTFSDSSGTATSADESLTIENVFLATEQEAPQNQPPIITEITGPTNLMINASGTWVITAEDPEEKPLSYQVDWGNGATSTQSSSTFTYVYSSTGTLTITFTVYDDQGLSASRTSTITIREPFSSCGDVNSDGIVDIGDIVYLVNYRLKSGPAPDPQIADVNADGVISKLDEDYLISYLYKGGSAPLCSQPKAATCGNIIRDGVINQLDIEALIEYLFKGGSMPYRLRLADVNSDGIVDVGDVVTLINYLNRGGPAPLCPANHPPLFTGPTSTSGIVGSLIEFTVTASDQDGDPLVLSWSIPEGASYSTSTGKFSWTPQVMGTSTAWFSAFDGIATSTHEVLLEVLAQPEPPPPGGGGGGGGGGSYFSLPPLFINFNPPTSATSTFLYSYKVEAYDPEREIIIFVLRIAPPGMTIDSRSGLIEWLPKTEQTTSTPYLVTVQISDGDNRVSTSYSIIVNSPIIELAPLQPKIAATTTIIETPESREGFGERPKKPLLTPSISIISTSTLTTTISSATTTAPAGGPSLLALLTPLLSMGLFDYSGTIVGWIKNNYCILGFLLWVLTLLTFFTYVLRNQKEKNEEIKKKTISELESIAEGITETVIPLNPPRIESV